MKVIELIMSRSSSSLVDNIICWNIIVILIKINTTVASVLHNKYSGWIFITSGAIRTFIALLLFAGAEWSYYTMLYWYVTMSVCLLVLFVITHSIKIIYIIFESYIKIRNVPFIWNWKWCRFVYTNHTLPAHNFLIQEASLITHPYI